MGQVTSQHEGSPLPAVTGLRRSLTRTIDRHWRAARTGLAFVAFGLGSLVVAFIALPVVRILARDDRRRQLQGQRVVHLAFRALLRIVWWLRVVRVRRHGAERLRGPGPRLVVANHPTLIDVVVLIACMPQADCVVKQAHWRNPLMRRVVTGAGYLSNLEGEGLVDACVERLRQGRTLVLFPEGTRSPQGQLGAFHRGAAHIALRSGCDPIPVTIRCEPAAFVKGARWHDVPDRLVEITMEVGEPLVMGKHSGPAVEVALAARRATTTLRAFYEDRLAGGRPGHARA